VEPPAGDAPAKFLYKRIPQAAAWRHLLKIGVPTRNAHKVQEISQILGDGFRFLTLRDFPEVPVAVEDADTFAGNAAKKVLSLAEWLTAKPE
jgi:inosine/xanthosine triphosphate pyrophosphatase family protein